MPIPTVKLNSGSVIPEIGLGFYQTPVGEAAEIAYNGLKAGYRLLDSAQLYKNEEGVAQGITKWIKEDPENNKREDVIFTTKIHNTNHGYEKAKKSLKESIEKTKSIGYIDIVLIHSPIADDKERYETWKVLQEAVEAGTVKSIGVSNYGIKHLKQLLAFPDLKIKPVINQLELHPWLTRSDLTEYCKNEGIAVEAYSPLTRANKFDDPDLVKLGKKYGKSSAQVLIRWSLDKGFIPLPKTTHFDRLAPNLNVFDFKLTPEEVKLLSDKDEYLHFCWDPTVHPLDNEQ